MTHATPARPPGTEVPAETMVPLHIKLAHGLGAIAFGVKDNGFSTFLLIFYNQVLGLDAGLVGAAIMVALITDAVLDVVIGEASDRTQTRWGRRLPWLYAAAIPLGVAWWFLWHPPVGAGTAMTIGWLIALAIVVRALVSMCEVPSIALVPELTADYDERTVLMRYRFLFGWAGGLVLLLLAYGLFLVDGSGNTDVTQRAGYGPYALTGALMITLSVLLSALGQHRRVARPSPPPQSHGGLRGTVRAMRATLSHRAFLILAGAVLFAFVAQAITFALINYLLVFVWQLDRAAMTGYVFLLFASMIAAFVIVVPLSRRLGKRRGAVVASALSVVLYAVLYLWWVSGAFPGLPAAPSLPVLFAMVLFANASAITVMVLQSAMMADVVEASQADTGRRSEGLFFAGYFFTQKCATGIGIFIAGQILSRVGFPSGAQAGMVAHPVLHALVLAYVAALAVLAVGNIALLRRFPISRDDHEARVRRLAVTEDARGA